MAKSKKLTFNMIATDMEKPEVVHMEIQGKNKVHAFDVKKMLTMQESVSFVDDVYNLCVNVDNGVYRADLLDFAMRVFTLVYYAGISAPENLEAAQIVIYITSIYDDVLAVICPDQYKALYRAVLDKIGFAKRMMCATQSSRLGDLIMKMDAVLSDGNKAMETITSPDFLEKMNGILELANEQQDDAGVVNEEPENVVALFGNETTDDE